LPWDRLAGVDVRVAGDLHVESAGLGPREPTLVALTAAVDRDEGALYLSDPAALARVDRGGRAIAACSMPIGAAFPGLARRLRRRERRPRGPGTAAGVGASRRREGV